MSRDAFVHAARARAKELFEAFEVSPEANALDAGAVRWPILVMREACLRHGQTIDTMTPEVFQAMTEIFVESDTFAAYGHWCGVVQEELEAFFRFLARTGFHDAERFLEVLARIGPIREQRHRRLIEASITPISEEQAMRFAMLASCMAIPSCTRTKRD